MSTTNPDPAQPHSLPGAVFPLENGDCLTGADFERRWEQMPHLKHAELVEGIVYMGAAIRHQQHGRPHGELFAWLTHYLVQTQGLDVGDNSTLRLDENNVLQPDALLRIPAELGGQSRVTDDGYLAGPPELVAEVAASSASLDLHAKREVYCRHGVQEYLVWRVLDEQFNWFVLRNGGYVELQADEAGVLKSGVFPGLWLDRAALLGGNLQQVAAVLQQGLSSEEHAAFVNCLQKDSERGAND